MKLLLGILLGMVLVGVGAAAFLWSGMFNVAAVAPAGKMEEEIAEFALNRSIAKRAPERKNPFAGSPDVWKAGLSHYRENCVACHGAPGVDASEFGQGLNPPAPDLTLPRVQARSDGQLFWITSNGIRMTGMPAFSPTHKEDEIWQIVAFVRHLEELTAEEEKELESETADDHHHAEAAAQTTEPAKPAASHEHAPGTKPHKD